MWECLFRSNRHLTRCCAAAVSFGLSFCHVAANAQQLGQGNQDPTRPTFQVVLSPDGQASASAAGWLNSTRGTSVPPSARCRANHSVTNASVYAASNFGDDGLVIPPEDQPRFHPNFDSSPGTAPRSSTSTSRMPLANGSGTAAGIGSNTGPSTRAVPRFSAEPGNSTDRLIANSESPVPGIPDYHVDVSRVATSTGDCSSDAEECRRGLCVDDCSNRWWALPDMIGDLLRTGGSRVTTFRPVGLSPMSATGNVVLDVANNRFVYHDAANSLLVPGNAGLGSTFVFFRAPGGGTLMQTTNAQGLTGFFGLERVSIDSGAMTTTVDSDFDILSAAGSTTVTDPVSAAMFSAMNNTAHWSVPTLSPINPAFINVGLVKQAEGGSPLPRNRVFLNYSLFDNVPLSNGININRITPGFELMVGDSASIEVRAPFATTLDSDFHINGVTNTRHLEMGDVTVSLKQVLASTNSTVISGGVQISVPTADDIGYMITDGGRSGEFLRLENETVHVMPFIGGAFVPNDRFFLQAMLQFDFDARGKPVLTSIDPLNGVPLTETGRLNDAAFVYGDLSAGYWVSREPAESTRTITGFAPILELHFNRSITKTDQVNFAPLGSLGVAGQDIDFLNGTVGCVLELQHQSNLTLGYTMPLAGARDEEFDGELRVMYVRKIGPR